MLVFRLASWIVLYAVLRTQGAHPFNPQGFASGPWSLSFNTASSFVSNTSWQCCAGETTLSYFSQMFVPILFALAPGGALAPGRVSPVGLGTLRADTPTVVIFLTGFVIIFALLNFLAALFIGPLDRALTQHLYS